MLRSVFVCNNCCRHRMQEGSHSFKRKKEVKSCNFKVRWFSEWTWNMSLHCFILNILCARFLLCFCVLCILLQAQQAIHMHSPFNYCCFIPSTLTINATALLFNTLPPITKEPNIHSTNWMERTNDQTSIHSFFYTFAEIYVLFLFFGKFFIVFFWRWV